MQKFNCKHCGAELYWDSSVNCLKCEYCGSEYQATDFEAAEQEEKSEKKQENETSTKEPQKADEYAKATDDSESVELVVYQCTHCGAEIVTAKSTVATTCAFCSRAISMTDKLVDNFRPEAVIPFLVDEKKAQEIYKKYIRSTFLTPKEFGTEGVLKKMKGIYVPFWLHSFENNTRALVYCENLISKRRGDDKIIEHHMYHVNVDAEGRFTDIPTDGLKHLDNALMDAIEPFDYNKLQDFSPAYMAGYYAEEYNEDDKVTRERATDRAKQTMLSEIESAAGAYAVKQVRNFDENLSQVSAKYAMLPVWLLNVEYKGKDYLYALNGETGKIAGKLPMSMKKLVISSLVSIFGSYIVVTLIRLLTLL